MAKGYGMSGGAAGSGAKVSGSGVRWPQIPFTVMSQSSAKAQGRGQMGALKGLPRTMPRP